MLKGDEGFQANVAGLRMPEAGPRLWAFQLRI